MASPISNPAAAAGAYASTAKAAGLSSGAEETGKPSFSDMLGNYLKDSINTLKAGETMSARAVTGEANLPDVVQAVNAADLTLQTVVAIRDRMVNAYSELMRMQM